MSEGEVLKGSLTPPSFRHRVNCIARSSGVARMLPVWCCIAIAALELGNGDS